MSKLQELINELCPDGVEYVRIGDVTNYEQPSKYIVNSTDYKDDYTTPVLTAGQTFILGYTDEQNGIYQANKNNPVIIFDDFTGALKWVDFPFKVKSSAMKLITAKDNISIRFLYYIMANIGFKSDEHKRLWISVYSEFEIPIPPLAVQTEIVRILDHFTNLAAELQAELQARREQYEFYRNKLLSFEGVEGVTWKKMSEMFEFRNGYTPSKANADFWTNGTIPWFRMEDIRTNGRILSDSIQHITKEAVKGGRYFTANSFILATTATIGEHALLIADSLANQQFTNFKIRESLENSINIKYMFHYFYIIDEWCKDHVNISGFASVDMNGLKNLEIPLPPLAEQTRIADILDRFEALTTDLSEGLPAEIAAVQEQYEYYRNKLLTFNRLSA